MKKCQTSYTNGIQNLLCPFTKMKITQPANGGYSHRGTMAVDISNGDSARAPYYAPCDLVCTHVIKSYGESHWQSLDKVRFANGQVDYLTMLVCHDDTITARVGMKLNQGQQLGNMGTKYPKAGVVTGVHCHILSAKGKHDKSKYYKNEFGNYKYPDDLDIDEVYFFDDTEVLNCPTLVKRYTKDIPTYKVKLVEPDEYKNQITANFNIQVRKQPDVNSEKVTIIHANERVDFYEIIEKPDYDWYRIDDHLYIADDKDHKMLKVQFAKKETKEEVKEIINEVKEEVSSNKNELEQEVKEDEWIYLSKRQQDKIMGFLDIIKKIIDFLFKRKST